ncbi:radical SAM/SPASM domain-containing protein [Terriglobus sp. 2YAB30_2]|uniref:radical SAM protein n=1 Tax=unclassified Terriglobus TaxID=2628988 RepID=UPI003F982CA5
MPETATIAETPHLQEHRKTRMPILLLHVHSRCNCRCAMCDIWKREENQELDLAVLERQRESLLALGVEQVVFTGGEALMHRKLPELTHFFREIGATLTLLTSGLLLEKHAALVAAEFQEVIVSLDGPPEVHDQIRGVKGAFALLSRGVHALKRRSTLPVRARCTVQHANFAHLAATVGAAIDAGLDGLSFLAADLSSTAFNRELVWPIERRSSIQVDATELETLNRQLDLVAEARERLAPAFSIAESRKKLQRIADHFAAEAGLVPHRAPVCNAPWVSAVWEVDGTVKPCFFHQPIGNLGHGTLEDILHSDSAFEFRSHLKVDENEICRRCVCSLNYQPSNEPGV